MQKHMKRFDFILGGLFGSFLFTLVTLLVSFVGDHSWWGPVFCHRASVFGLCAFGGLIVILVWERDAFADWLGELCEVLADKAHMRASRVELERKQ